MACVVFLWDSWGLKDEQVWRRDRWVLWELRGDFRQRDVVKFPTS